MNAFVHQLTWRDLYLLLGAIALLIIVRRVISARRKRRGEREMLAILSIHEWIERSDVMEHLARFDILIAWDEFASMTQRLQRRGIIEIEDVVEPGIVGRTIVISHRYRLTRPRSHHVWNW